MGTDSDSKQEQFLFSSQQHDAFETALLSTNRGTAQKIIADSCSRLPPLTCIETLIIPVLEEIGKKWETGEVALSQVYMSGRYCEEIVDAMLPPGHPDRKNQPKMAIGVLEDHHTLGKRILISIIRAAGYEILDYGAGISAHTMVDNVTRDQIKVLLISTLMLPAALKIKDVTSQIREKIQDTRIIVGGAPFRFDKTLYTEVGADAMGYSASDTLKIIQNIMGEMMA